MLLLSKKISSVGLSPKKSRFPTRMCPRTAPSWCIIKSLSEATLAPPSFLFFLRCNKSIPADVRRKHCRRPFDPLSSETRPCFFHLGPCQAPGQAPGARGDAEKALPQDLFRKLSRTYTARGGRYAHALLGRHRRAEAAKHFRFASPPRGTLSMP